MEWGGAVDIRLEERLLAGMRILRSALTVCGVLFDRPVYAESRDQTDIHRPPGGEPRIKLRFANSWALQFWTWCNARTGLMRVLVFIVALLVNQSALAFDCAGVKLPSSIVICSDLVLRCNQMIQPIRARPRSIGGVSSQAAVNHLFDPKH